MTVPTDMNLADLGTRPNVTPEMLGTDFQCGMGCDDMLPLQIFEVRFLDRINC